MIQLSVGKMIVTNIRDTVRGRLLVLAGALSFAALLPTELAARNWRVNQMPNGSVFSCGTCHFNSNGGGSRNAFGTAVEQLVSPGGTEDFWSQSLALQDSDGDRFSNGQELGDPNGFWPNFIPGPSATNPGDANSKPNRAPGFTSSPITSASVGVLYSYQATALDLDNDPITFSKIVGPQWLTVSAGGLVSGTPPPGSGGAFPVTLRVVDSGLPPLTADQNYTLTVTSPNSAPSFTSSPVTIATEGVAYSYQAAASDPESNPLTFSKVSGPAWISVAAGGLVSGTPPAGVAGSHAIVIRVADNGTPALTADQSFSLVVSASFAAWQAQNFALPAENAIAGPNQDPDNDGLPNLVEYALKTAPKQASAIKLMSNRAFTGGGQLQFSQVFRDDDPKLSVKFEAAATVPYASPAVISAVLTDPTPGDGFKTWTFTDPVSKNNTATRFGRLRFEILP